MLAGEMLLRLLPSLDLSGEVMFSALFWDIPADLEKPR